MDHDEMYHRFDCVDCGINTHDTDEYYMVHDHVWNKAGMSLDSGMLCIGCLEERIGRELNAADFTDAPVNQPPWIRGPRLEDRLSRMT